MTFDETARLMAQAVLDGDAVAACQLADWLIDGYGRPAPPGPRGAEKLLVECGLPRHTFEKVSWAVLFRLEELSGRRLMNDLSWYRRFLTLGDLTNCSADDVSGPKTLPRVRTLLARYGLHLAGDVPVTPAPPE